MKKNEKETLTQQKNFIENYKEKKEILDDSKIDILERKLYGIFVKKISGLKEVNFYVNPSAKTQQINKVGYKVGYKVGTFIKEVYDKMESNYNEAKQSFRSDSAEEQKNEISSHESLTENTHSRENLEAIAAYNQECEKKSHLNDKLTKLELYRTVILALHENICDLTQSQRQKVDDMLDKVYKCINAEKRPKELISKITMDIQELIYSFSHKLNMCKNG